MISYKPDIKKIVQAVNFILKKNKGSINYTKLIKLLYIADKEFLRKYDMTISGDFYCSLDNGPILSTVYDLIKGTGNVHDQLYWDSFFCKDGYDLILVHENKLPTDKLSKAEIEFLQETDNKFRKYSFDQMIEYTHKKELFPEVKWEEAKASSIPLSVDDILKSLGRSDTEIKNIKREIDSQKAEAEFFTDCCQ